MSLDLKVGHKKKKSATFLKNDVSIRMPKPTFFVNNFFLPFFANGQVQFKGSKSPAPKKYFLAANSGNRVNRMALGPKKKFPIFS